MDFKSLMIWQWKVSWLSRKPLARWETLLFIFHLLPLAPKFLTALNGHNLCVVSGSLKKFWGRNYLCFLESCASCSLALVIFLSFFTSALVWVEGKTPPSIKHNFSAYFIIFRHTPSVPPTPWLWHLHLSTPFHYLTSCDYDLPGKGLFTLWKVHKRCPSFSPQLDWLIVLVLHLVRGALGFWFFFPKGWSHWP